jgi:hypothetical protein
MFRPLVTLILNQINIIQKELQLLKMSCSEDTDGTPDKIIKVKQFKPLKLSYKAIVEWTEL